MIDAHGETTFSRQSCYFQGTAMYASYGDVIGGAHVTVHILHEASASAKHK